MSQKNALRHRPPAEASVIVSPRQAGTVVSSESGRVSHFRLTHRLMPDTVYLVDTFSLMFQVFHAIPSMTSPAGFPTNAAFGFSRDLLSLLHVHRPTWLICALESTGIGTRESRYPEYKANRSEMPVDLRPQIPLLIEVMKAFGVPAVNSDGWEADDVIATLTRQAVERGHQVRIVTSDKDARQLLGPQVQILNIRKKTYLDEAALLLDWGVRPDQVIDFQALVGDAVDNVPGVPLVGPKKASALLQQFETLEGVLANADQVSAPKLRENLKLFAEQARLSQTLVTLNQHLDLGFDWERSRLSQPNIPVLQELFRKLGFRSLINEIKILLPPEPAASTTAKRPESRRQARSLFEEEAVDSSELPSPVSESTSGSASALRPDSDPEAVGPYSRSISNRRWETIDTPERLSVFVCQLRQTTRFCLDLETTGLNPRSTQIVGWAVCWEPGLAYYLPTLGPPGSRLLEGATVIDALKPILESRTLRLVNQNLKFDLMVLDSHGIHVHSDAIDVDPMVGDYLLDVGARSHSLDTLVQKYLGITGIPITELIGSGKMQKNMSEVSIERIAEYATEDADLTLRLADLISEQLQARGLWDLYWTLERPLIPVLVEMEQAGIRVDTDELNRQSDDLGLRLASLMSEIYTLAGREFNIDSPKQLQVVLFDELKLPIKRKTKTGASTDQEVLEELAALHPLPARIMEHRHFTKLKGTYLDAIPQLVHARTGRIHTSFNQVVAATGRLSSSDPNLQNIPIRTPEGERIRRAFIPVEPSWRLVCADYSQIELRILAHFSQDPELISAFAAGVDIHTAAASQVFGIAYDAVTSQQRRMAKAVNFGVIYGQSSYGLAATLDISQDEAASFINGYFTKYAGVAQFIEETLTDVQHSGFAKTIRGRIRPIDGIRPRRTGNLNMPERTAVNTVIQGSAADLIKTAMLAVRNRLKLERHSGRMLLQIHDELVFESPAQETALLVNLVRHEMEHAMKLTVPLVVVVSVGENWLDTSPILPSADEISCLEE